MMLNVIWKQGHLKNGYSLGKRDLAHGGAKSSSPTVMGSKLAMEIQNKAHLWVISQKDSLMRNEEN